MNKLPCIIDNQANPVNILTDGLEAGLTDELEKHSSTENRNCIYKKEGKLLTLPKYLVVQEVRFIWKKKDIGTVTDARKAKILRAVSFPKILDIEPFCAKELKIKLAKGKEILKQQEESRNEQEKLAFEEFKNNYLKKEDVDTLKITKAFKKQRAEELI